MSFDDIPNRENAEDVDASWWNLLKSAGQEIEGGADQKMTLADGAGPTALLNTALEAQIIDESSLRTVVFQYTVARRDDTEGRREYGTFTAYFEEESGEWNLDQKIDGGKYTDLPTVISAGFTVTIDNTGALFVTTTLMGGANHSSTLRWSILKKYKKESL